MQKVIWSFFPYVCALLTALLVVKSAMGSMSGDHCRVVRHLPSPMQIPIRHIKEIAIGYQIVQRSQIIARTGKGNVHLKGNISSWNKK